MYRAWVLCAGLLAACAAAPRKPAPPTLFAQAVPMGFPPTGRFLGIDVGFYTSHAQQAQERVRAAAGNGALNILALSGGGAGGAFGAGALVGLSRRGERPRFQIVTGVSAGALIAPFAFLGSGWDGELTDAFASDRAAHLLQSRGIGFLFGTAVYHGQPLRDLVNHFVTGTLVRAVAAESAKGRLWWPPRISRRKP